MTDSALHVAVGVIRDQADRILLTRRADHVHQGGLWEFPGGKLESNENVFQALQRELHEEIGIEVKAASPLIKIRHRYPDLTVLLDVWTVTDYSGSATPREGQAMRWVEPEQLADFGFPAANLPIVSAVRLSNRYAVLEGQSREQVLGNLQRIIANKVELLQVRMKALPAAERQSACLEVLEICREQRIRVLINADLSLPNIKAEGLHLSSRLLMKARCRPIGYDWVAASCHNLAELKHAESIGVDFAVLAPVMPTATHPLAEPLGWDQAATLIGQVNLPVFVMGGLGLSDIDSAIESGAQGIAGISAFL